MCEDFLEDNTEGEGLGYIVDAITGGQDGGPLTKPLTAASLAKYLERLADGYGTWEQIVDLMTQDLEEGEGPAPDNLMLLTDLPCCGLTAKYEDS